MLVAADGKAWELNSSDSRLVKAWHDKLCLSIDISKLNSQQLQHSDPAAGNSEVRCCGMSCSGMCTQHRSVVLPPVPYVCCDAVWLRSRWVCERHQTRCTHNQTHSDNLL